MRTIFNIFLIFPILIISSLVESAVMITFTGNELHEYLNGVNHREGGWYILGIADSLSFNNEICLPNKGVGAQPIDVVKNYLEDNPQERHNQAFAIITIALKNKFKCK